MFVRFSHDFNFKKIAPSLWFSIWLRVFSKFSVDMSNVIIFTHESLIFVTAVSWFFDQITGCKITTCPFNSSSNNIDGCRPRPFKRLQQKPLNNSSSVFSPGWKMGWLKGWFSLLQTIWPFGALSLPREASPSPPEQSPLPPKQAPNFQFPLVYKHIPPGQRAADL